MAERAVQQAGGGSAEKVAAHVLATNGELEAVDNLVENLEAGRPTGAKLASDPLPNR